MSPHQSNPQKHTAGLACERTKERRRRREIVNLQTRNARNVNSVIGCELRRQLRVPGAGCDCSMVGCGGGDKSVVGEVCMSRAT
jgi:hypothetical protein